MNVGKPVKNKTRNEIRSKVGRKVAGQLWSSAYRNPETQVWIKVENQVVVQVFNGVEKKFYGFR